MKLKTDQKLILTGDLVGLDLGMKKTGVARLSVQVRIAEALPPIQMTDEFVAGVQRIVDACNASAVVAGVPRNLGGEETDQTRWSRALADQLQEVLSVPVFGIDEAGTSKMAEERCKPGESLDSVAAGILLEDFIVHVERGKVEHVSL